MQHTTSESHSPTHAEGDFESQFLIVVQQIFVDILDGTPTGFLITIGGVAVTTHHLQVAVKHRIHHSVKHFDDIKIFTFNTNLTHMLTSSLVYCFLNSTIRLFRPA